MDTGPASSDNDTDNNVIIELQYRGGLHSLYMAQTEFLFDDMARGLNLPGHN